MKIYDEIEKTYNEILLKYEKDEFKCLDENYKFYVKRMKNLLLRRTENYKIIAKRLEAQLLRNVDAKKTFKKTFKQLDKLVINTIVDIKVDISRKEKNFKIGLINGVKEEHELFMNCFIRFRTEVRNNADI